jgi:two-component system sensor histidine kinase CpxA
MFRTLFAKFLLWFWLALAVMLGAEIVLEATSLEQGLVLHPEAASGPFRFYADLAGEALERGGTAGLDSLLTRLEGHGDLVAFCFDSTGEPTGGRRAPHGAQEAGLAALRSGTGMLVESPRGLFVGYPLGRAGGRDLALVLHPLPHRAGRPPGSESASGEAGWVPFLPYDLALRTLIMLVVGGVGCYLLARSVTAPVARLREATRRLAGGDLGARVGQEGRPRHDELADLGRDFDRMADRLEKLVAAQRRLLGDISHELRSPLARMKVAIALLRQDGAEDRERMVARLETEADRLNRLIGDLLTLSRVEAGGPGPGGQRVDLGALAAEVAEDARFEASARRCEVGLARPAAVVVSGEPGLLRSALENVVRNAVRHTGEGTAVEITVERRPVAGGFEAAVAVRDHGPGLPADQLERIFEPFYRVDDEHGRDWGGTGLGLAITRRVVEQHGGRIQAAAAPGGGLVVTIVLPAA